ncbi:integrase [Limnochorda pilosa]|uniref:Integrase n=1 Tax=Limnochorda pilosa TaxID=1555112 RepID=A0A0K2SI05_LIMPI|nr:integrase [Limnochorda pilosa]
MREALRSRHYSQRTEESYCLWVRRFIRFQNLRHPAEMGEAEINAFLSHLATHEKVSASTRNQALSALLFLYRNVLRRDLGDLGSVIRARKPRRLPVVLTKEEVKAVLAELEGAYGLIASLMYRSGLRLTECLSLWVQDIDVARGEILVRDGRGAKDRMTMLPEELKEPLRRHLRAVKATHERDLREGWGQVELPQAVAPKYPRAAADWRWRWVFPQARRWRNPRTGQQGRHHMHGSLVQKAVAQAVRRAGLTKRASCHAFRHSFATHLLADGTTSVQSRSS